MKARLPIELALAIEKKAQENGMNVQDYIGTLAEAVTGVPYDPQGGFRLSA
uniref:hypothetical protein n=1 Tax=Amycolatopsis sp. CA-290885 TaxID=3239925 RepID=UPI003F497484